MSKFYHNELLINSAIYTGSGSVPAILSFLLLPVLTRELSSAEYGIIGMFMVLQLAATKLSAFGVNTSVSREYYVEKVGGQRELVSTAVVYFLGTGAILTILLWIFQTPLFRVSGVPTMWIIALGGMAALNWLNELGMVISRNMDKPWQFAGMLIASAIVATGASYVLVVSCGLGVDGRLLGIFLGLCAGAIWSLAMFASYGLLSVTYRHAIMLGLVGLGAPLLLHGAGEWALGYANRLILKELSDMHAVGQLTIAVSVGGILSIPIQGFLRSLAPWIMSQMTLNTRGGLTNVVRTNVFVHLFGFAAGLVALLVLQHVFFWIVDKKFAPALAMMPWILMTQYATLSFGSAFPILLFERKTMSIGIISLVASAAGVAATFLLVPYFDADGAAMGIAVGYVTRAVIVSYIAHSILAMHRATPVESR